MKQKQNQTKTLNKEPEALDQIIEADIKRIKSLKQKENDLSKYLSVESDKLWSIAADILRGTDKDRYLSRLALTIANDEVLKPCFETAKGKLSIIQVMQKAIELGVTPGDDAYIIPYGQDGSFQNGKWQFAWYKANLEPRSEAYMKICLSEPNPLFKQILHDIVYEKDTITINTGVGEITHNINPTKGGRGDIIGAWIKLVPCDESIAPIVKYWDIGRVYEVRDKFSLVWKQYQKKVQLYQDCEDNKVSGAVKLDNGNYKITTQGKRDQYVNKPDKTNNPWFDSKEQMIVKTIIKGELKRYALIKPTSANTALKPKEVEKHSDMNAKADEKLNNMLDNFEDATPAKNKDQEFFKEVEF